MYNCQITFKSINLIVFLTYDRFTVIDLPTFGEYSYCFLTHQKFSEQVDNLSRYKYEVLIAGA